MYFKGYEDYIWTMKKHFEEVHSTLGGTKVGVLMIN